MTIRSGTKELRPLQGHSPQNRTWLSPGVFFHRKGELRSSYSATSTNNTEAPQYAFSREGGIYRSDVAKLKPNPGAGSISSRRPTPGPRQRTRREEHDLLIVRDEFRTGYSSIGLLASRARLRFTGIARINWWTENRERNIIEW